MDNDPTERAARYAATLARGQQHDVLSAGDRGVILSIMDEFRILREDNQRLKDRVANLESRR
jgi:hypothetical protein